MQRSNCQKHKRWSQDVRERDNFKCRNCGRDKNLQAHHVIPWNINESLRFDISNGITVCGSCHAKIEKRGYHNKGKVFTDEHRKKLSEAKKGKHPWNYGNRNILPEEKICKDCGEMKKITEFTPQGDWYKHRCKTCRNALLKKKRDGEVNGNK